MRFLTRAMSGLIIASITLGLIGLGVWRLYGALGGIEARRAEPARERSYAVEVATLAPRTVRPVITAYGEVRAWRMLEVRAAAAGPITELSERFRDGATVRAGERLFGIDPTDYRRRVRDAQIALAQARADLAEAKELFVLAAAESRIAKRQLGLKNDNLARKRALRGKGIVAQLALDEARSGVANAQQILNSSLKAELAARMGIQGGDFGIQRAMIALEDANKALADTRYHAPFAGPLTGVVATLGRRVTQNEVLGTLIDPATLEVSFRVTDEAFGRLLTARGGSALKPLAVTAMLALGTRRVEVAGTLDRAAAVSRLSDGGRMVFARIAAGADTVLRPGDFVTVEIEEEPIANVAVVPAQAVSQDGRVFLIGTGDRLEEVTGTIVRRQAGTVVMAGLPFGRRYVRARLPYLGAGIAVKPREAGAPPAARLAHLEARIKGGGRLIALDDARRARLIGYVKSRELMPEEIRTNILAALAEAKVPRAMVDRLEARIRAATR